MRTLSSKLSLIIFSLFLFAGCTKPSPAPAPAPSPKQDKAQDPAKLTPTKVPDKDAVLEQKPPTDTPAIEREESPKDDTTAATGTDENPEKPNPSIVPLPNPGKITVVPAPAPTKTPEPPTNPTTEAPTQVDPNKDLEVCLNAQVIDLVSLLRTESTAVTQERLAWVIERAKYECKITTIEDSRLLTRLETGLKETALKAFPDFKDLINNFSLKSTPKPQAQPEPKTEKIVKTIDYKYKSIVHYGSKDFRQPEHAMNYSISKVQKNVQVGSSGSSDLGPMPIESSKSTSFGFGYLAEYSFGFILNSNNTYTLIIKDDEDNTLNLDYQFYEGSLDGLKKGDSAKIALTKKSWIKVIEAETQKIISQNYSHIPRASLKLSFSSEDPKAVRGCSIGKGYFLGSHAIACMDPEFTIRIQIIDRNQ